MGKGNGQVDQSKQGYMSMDPNETWAQVLLGISNKEWGNTLVLIQSLEDWVKDGGFLPTQWKGTATELNIKLNAFAIKCLRAIRENKKRTKS